MSAFTNGFNIGFVNGMFNRMFGSFNPFGFWNSMPMCSLMPMWNSMPTLFSNNFMQSNFNSWQQPMQSLWNYNTVPMQFNFSNTPMPNIDWFESSSRSNNSSNTSTVTAPRTSNDFDKMLKFVLSIEDGYTPNDCGQPANKGIQQRTYNAYRRKKGLPQQSVKKITDAEVKDLYYNDYYKASGADKIKDARLALYVFDAAVNMGVGTAKVLLSKCGNDPEKFIKLRNAKYESIASNNNDKKKYLKNWKNRVAKAKDYANKEFVA